MILLLRLVSGVWSFIFWGIGASMYGNDSAFFYVIAVLPWIILLYKGYLKSASGNPYMDMTSFIRKTGFPKVNFSSLPMERDEFPFYAVPARRTQRGSSALVGGTYLVTNKRICFISPKLSFGVRINEVESAVITGANILCIKMPEGTYHISVNPNHIGYAYSFTNGSINGLEEIDYSLAKNAKEYLSSLYKK